MTRKIARHSSKSSDDNSDTFTLNSGVATSNYGHPGRPTARLPRSLEELKSLIKLDD